MTDRPNDDPTTEAFDAASNDAASEVEEPAETTEPGADDAPEELGDLARITGERDEYLESLQRVAAEFDNYRKRVERERIVATSQAGRDVLEQLLPVMDSLERAVEALADVDEARSGGIVMVQQQLAGVLAGRGLARVEPLEGDVFNPEIHDAVQSLPSPDHAEGTLMAVVQTGYLFSDGTVLRPARVVVAGAGPE